MLMTLHCVASEKSRLKKNLEEWRRAMQDRGLKINRKKTNCIPEAEFQYGNLDGNADINLYRETIRKECIHLYI